MTLYDQIASRNLLRQGWRRTAENNGMPGADGVSVRMFELRLERELNALQGELQARAYTTRPLLRFDIPKAKGKIRTLSIPAVRDRVVQSAALLVLGPIVDRELETCSFAYRPGLSYRDAITHLRRLRDEGYAWVVDADIEAFFDRVDHGLLMTRFAELVSEADVQALIRQWIAADAVYEKKRVRRTEGLPQGAVVSPLLANLYLDRFDEALAEQGLKLVRYADDFVILCRSQPRAEAALRLTEDLLEDLELRINREKTRITSFNQGFRFLGSLFIRSLVLPSKNKRTEAVPLRRKTAEAAPGEPASEAAPPGEEATPDEEKAPRARTAAARAVPDRAELERTALGRAFVRALDAEGLAPSDFLHALAAPAPGEAEPPAALALSEEAFPDPDAPLPVEPGAAPFMRTLYIREQGTWLRINSGRFVVTAGREPREELLALPAFKVEQVVIFGHCLITPAALRYCLRQHIPVFLLSSRGRYYGKVASMQDGDVSRQRLQFIHALDEAFRLDLARRFVEAKLHNTRSLLRRYARRLKSEPLHATAGQLTRLLRQLPQAETLDALRGYEGQGAALYFGVFGALFPDVEFSFRRRTRRPPTDPVNALLSLGYTLLYNNLYALVRQHRMNPYVGLLHTERAGHPALVSDLIEEFRFLIERMAVALCNRHALTPDDFYRPEPSAPDEPTGCFLTDDGYKTFIRAFEHAMHREVTHPATGRKTSYRRCLDLQVRALARHLEGAEPYVPFKIT